MARFGNLFGGEKAARREALAARIAQEPATRLVEGYPSTWRGELGRAAGAVDVDGVLSLYGSLDVSGRYYLLEDFEDFFDPTTPDGAALTDRWMTRMHGSAEPLVKTLAGVAHNAIGWAIRGRGTADTVGPQAADAFRGHLLAGLDLLAAAGSELGGADIVPYLHAQSSAYGLPAGQQDEVAKLWQGIDRFNRHGLYKLGVQLDERWFGDEYTQLIFAEWIAQTAPAGTEGLVVVPELVMERWEYLSLFEDLDDDECAAETVEHDLVKNMVVTAYQKLFQSGLPVDPRTAARHLNFFGWAFFMGDEDALAWDVFSRLRGQALAAVWAFNDDEDPVQAYNDARDYLIEHVALA